MKMLTGLLVWLLIFAPNLDAKIKRSTKAKNEFKRVHPCPATGKKSGSCNGYVIDHVIPLACGGPDKPFNMQWQTFQQAKAKDKWERKDCAQWYAGKNKK